MTALIQYILTSAQSFGSQDYYNRSLMTILGLAGVLFCKMSRHEQNGLSFVPKKILIWVPREARRGLKGIAEILALVFNLRTGCLFMILFCWSNISGEASATVTDYYDIFQQLKKATKAFKNDVTVTISRTRELHGLGTNYAVVNDSVIRICQSKLTRGDIRSNDIEHHIASAMTIFQFFYGVLQQLQIDESRKNTLNSRKWILVKQFRNLEFKLRNLTETTFRTATHQLVQNKPIVPSYSVGNLLKSSQHPRNQFGRKLNEFHVNQLYQLSECINIYLDGDVRKETQ